MDRAVRFIVMSPALIGFAPGCDGSGSNAPVAPIKKGDVQTLGAPQKDKG